MSLTKEELTKYLQYATQLEASIFKQEKSYKEADNMLVWPQKAKVTKEYIPEPSKPTEPIAITNNQKTTNYVLTVICFVAGLALFILGISLFAKANSFLVTLLFLGGVGFCYLGFLEMCTIMTHNNIERKHEDEEYEYRRGIENYDLEYKEYIKKCEEAERQYKVETNKAEAEYQRKKQYYNTASSAVSKIEWSLRESKAALDKLYSLGIVFPKYRNLVAVSTIYEYFASGRVTELEGPTGAYNLYENELRMNQIIDKLDVIITKLDEIKANQYALYNELRDTNKIVDGIRKDVAELVKSSHRIEDATRITALCSQVTAQNSKALKYIALVKR